MQGKIRKDRQNKLWNSFLPLGIGVTLAILGGMSYLSDRENEAYQYKINLQLAKSIHQQIENVENLTFQFIANFELNKTLNQYIESKELYQIAPFNTVFSAFLESQTRSHPLLWDAAFFALNEPKRKDLTMSDNLTQTILTELRSTSSFQKILELDGRFFLDTETVFPIQGKKSLLCGRLIKKVDGERTLGVLLLLLRTERLSEMINSDLYVDGEPVEGTLGNYFSTLVSSAGMILASPLKDQIGRMINEVFHTSWIRLPESVHKRALEGEWKGLKVYLRTVPIGEGIPIFLIEVSTLPTLGYRNILVFFFGILLMGIGVIQAKSLKEKSFSPIDAEASKQFEKLPAREREILLLLAQGYSNKEIAYQLHLREQTVKNYLHSLYTKIGIHDRVSAALFVKKARRDIP
ncbi:MAG: LuxR C-terminal-related transcriptional regulator [Spirochaetes bacterium]|nr:LuxR C-terminal-related transcriptional regulator [Spirochaetota bacterium]